MDSLQKELLTLPNDTDKLKTMNLLARELINTGNFDRGLDLSSKALLMCDKFILDPKINVKRVKDWKAFSIINLAIVRREKGDFAKAFEYYLKGLELKKEIGDRKGEALALNSIGSVYREQENYKTALDYFFTALNIMKEINNKNEVTGILMNIGVVYGIQHDYSRCMEYMMKCLKVREESGDKYALAVTYNNLGILYNEMGNWEMGMKYQEKALKLRIENNDQRGIASSYMNFGSVYKGRSIKATGAEAARFSALSREFMNKATTILRKIGIKVSLKMCYGHLSYLDSLDGNFKGSLENYRIHIKYKDSLQNEDIVREMVTAEMNNEFDKKEALARQEQERKDLIALEESQKQIIMRNAFIIGFVLMILLAVFIFRGYRQKQRSSQIISGQKQEFEKQKIMVEQKQLQILDSIKYAKRIQNSILIPEPEIKKHLPEAFILYLPKDIVSGDFYWFATVGNVELGGRSANDAKEKAGYSDPRTNHSELILVAADCTGHGVPGAFLSMVGSTLLNEIVIHNKITDPADIISQLSLGLHDTLTNKEKDEENTDGMDISICKLDLSQKNIFFAGANQSLYMVNSIGLVKVESQINSIDGIFGLKADERIFSEKRSLAPETMVYMTTDGYSDQIGEKSMKKFLTSRLEKMFTEIWHLPAHEQKQIIRKKFEDWKGGLSQVDDVLIIGFKI